MNPMPAFLGMIIICMVIAGILLGAAITGAKYILKNTTPNQPSESVARGVSSPTNTVSEGDFDNHLKRMRDR